MSRTSVSAITAKLRTTAAVLGLFAALCSAAGAQSPFSATVDEIQIQQRVARNTSLYIADAVMNVRPALATPLVGIGSVGTPWESHLRTEMGTQHSPSGFDKRTGVGVYGFVRASVVSANVVYALTASPKAVAYLGGGVGLNVLDWPRAAAMATPNFIDRTNDVQWHGIAGVTQRISPRLDAFVDYQRVTSRKSRLMNQSAGSTINAKRDRSHNILAGIRFSLNP